MKQLFMFPELETQDTHAAVEAFLSGEQKTIAPKPKRPRRETRAAPDARRDRPSGLSKGGAGAGNPTPEPPTTTATTEPPSEPTDDTPNEEDDPMAEYSDPPGRTDSGAEDAWTAHVPSVLDDDAPASPTPLPRAVAEAAGLTHSEPDPVPEAEHTSEPEPESDARRDRPSGLSEGGAGPGNPTYAAETTLAATEPPRDGRRVVAGPATPETDSTSPGPQKEPTTTVGERRTHVSSKSEMEGLPPIKVVGVGGGGCNAVNRMIEAKIAGVDFVGVNTDEQALFYCSADTQMKIGTRVTKGLGAGSDPDKGRAAAEESREEVKDLLADSEMVFITAGMGGGTGTGAAPIIAGIAKDLGALTVAVVTKPFGFEGSKRREQAERGIEALRQEVDTLIVIPNDRLLAICDQKATVAESFKVADDVLRQGIQGISEIITTPGDINLDFADVRRIMADAGHALMAIGRATGENRAVEAAQSAIASPLLDVNIHGATGVLFNVASSGTMALHELNMAAQVIAEVVDPSAEIIFGTSTDHALGDEVKITLIAVGFETATAYDTRFEDEEYRRIRQDAVENRDDMDLPTFLRRPVSMR